MVESESTTESGEDTLDLTLTELQTTFDYQVQRLREIDSKAIEILKANLLLIGIVVTAGSILVQTDLDVALFANAFTISGVGLLLVSTALAGVTYTVSNLRGGLGSEAVEVAIDSHRLEESEEYRERILRSYASWIEYNARVTAVNDMFATFTVLLVIDAFIFVFAGLVVGVFAPGLLISAMAFLGLTLVVALLTRIVYHMDHLGPTPPQPAATFDGIRLSKGATREDGYQALWEMLRKPTESDTPREDS